MSPLLLGGVSTLGIVLMLILLHVINVIQRKPSKASSLIGRPEKSLEEFVKQADEVRVSLRVARETYDLLLEHYPVPMCIDLPDDLRRDLKLSDADILKLLASILKKTDRLLTETSYIVTTRTVNDLLREVENTQRNKIDRSALRLRASDCPYPVRPVVEVIEFKQTSRIIDPDYQRRQHFTWLKRRISDYRGLLSRASDLTTKTTHQGPFRRSHEGSRSPSTGSYKRNAKSKGSDDQMHNPLPYKLSEPKADHALQPAVDHSAPAVQFSGPEYPRL